jgi:capsular polysaccharide biosynthesis protein
MAQDALNEATKHHRSGVAQAIALELIELDHERKSSEKGLHDIAISRDALADRINAAGLATRIAIVEEHRPDRPEHREFVLALVAIVIGFASLLGSVLLVGAFDSRVHDIEDVERLGLAVLGHVPGFAGDDVGSLTKRGIGFARVPCTKRWRRRS